MTAYYNEFDPGAAAWLRELIAGGHIAPGEVDERSILDVAADNLRGFTQCHFFAGIGGWSYALRLAGWPDDRPVWTGSPPCQPFSVAGQQKGRDDARHLAPHFISLVGAARPGVLFGEQVASADVFGKASKRARGNFVAPPQWAWLDDLSDRLEAARYAVGASDFPSAGVGAPHIRQRTFFGAVSHDWLADSDGAGRLSGAQRGIHCGQEGTGPRHGEPERFGDAGGLAQFGAAGPWKSYADWFGVCWHPECRDSDRGWCDCNRRGAPLGWHWDEHDGWLVDGLGARLEGHGRHGDGSHEPGRIDPLAVGSVAPAGAVGGMADTERIGREVALFNDGCRGAPCGERQADQSGVCSDAIGEVSGPLNGFWSDADWLFCRDGKWRPVEPGTFPLAHGISGRVGLLRGYGNAINPHAAAEFIRAFDASIRHIRLTEEQDIFG